MDSLRSDLSLRVPKETQDDFNVAVVRDLINLKWRITLNHYAIVILLITVIGLMGCYGVVLYRLSQIQNGI